MKHAFLQVFAERVEVVDTAEDDYSAIVIAYQDKLPELYTDNDVLEQCSFMLVVASERVTANSGVYITIRELVTHDVRHSKFFNFFFVHQHYDSFESALSALLHYVVDERFSKWQFEYDCLQQAATKKQPR